MSPGPTLKQMIAPVVVEAQAAVRPLIDLAKALEGQLGEFVPLDNRVASTPDGEVPTGGVWIAGVRGQPGVFLMLLNATSEVGRSENDKAHFGNTHGAASLPFMLSADGRRFYANLQVSETAAATRGRLEKSGKSAEEIAKITGKPVARRSAS